MLRKGEKSVLLSTRIPPSSYRVIDQFVRRGPYLHNSEFVRIAIFEKIQRDAPELYKTMFETDKKGEPPPPKKSNKRTPQEG